MLIYLESSMDQQIGNELPPLHSPEQGAQIPQNPFEVPAALGQSETAQAQNIERGVSQAPPTALPPIPDQPPMNAAISTAITQSNGLPGMPTIADDTDLIEKEWVLKAKEIVERTKHDPYQQNKEVERIKADYLKKRYNKDVKVTED
jgi:hypothetical protein